MELTEFEEISCCKLGAAIQKGKISNEGIVKILSIVETFFNPKTVSQYTRDCGGCYNTNTSKVDVEFGGTKFIFDNE